MRGTGPIRLGVVTVYGYFTRTGEAVRVRVSLDEWDRLGLTEGQPVRVGLPGCLVAPALVTSAARVPPYARIDLLLRLLCRAG